MLITFYSLIQTHFEMKFWVTFCFVACSSSPKPSSIVFPPSISPIFVAQIPDPTLFILSKRPSNDKDEVKVKSDVDFSGSNVKLHGARRKAKVVTNFLFFSYSWYDFVRIARRGG